MIQVENFASGDLDLYLDHDGDLCVEDSCGETIYFNRAEASQMAAILYHYATTGEVELT